MVFGDDFERLGLLVVGALLAFALWGAGEAGVETLTVLFLALGFFAVAGFGLLKATCGEGIFLFDGFLGFFDQGLVVLLVVAVGA